MQKYSGSRQLPSSKPCCMPYRKNYTTIPKLVDRSDLPMDELEEVIEETLRLNRQKNILPFIEANAAFLKMKTELGLR